MIDIYSGKKPYSNPKQRKSLKSGSVNLLFKILNVFRASPNKKAPSITHFPSKIDSSKLKPAIIVISGGGYFGRDVQKEGIPSSIFFQNIGFEVFLLNYRVSPYFYPTSIEDGKRSVQFIRFHAKKWDIDPQKIGVIGYSAGGHLASMITESKEQKKPIPIDSVAKVSCITNFQILCYPIINLKEKSLSIKFVRAMILGKSLKFYPDKELNSSLNVNKQTPKTFIWHSINDKTISIEHSKLYVKALAQYNVPHQVHFYQKGGHGIGLAKKEKFKNFEVYKWTTSCKEWLLDNVV
jgi:acetyl esterase/lipase